uniref:Superoxide dismutase copper/zinc binding domain-containing protein n=1 Tax=Plectus sambesii TaxID=2011161 RepID=A0A914WH06_9BILA
MWSLFKVALVLWATHTIADGRIHSDSSQSPPMGGDQILRGVAYLNSEDGSVYGRLRLDQFFAKRAPTHIYGNITGLSAGQHGIAIATWGNLTKGCGSVGPHFNPDLMTHGAPSDEHRHVGDLGNINGQEPVDITDHKVSLFGRNSVMGRAVVVYARPDDLGKSESGYSRIDGDAAPVIACGVIGRSLTDEFYR